MFLAEGAEGHYYFIRISWHLMCIRKSYVLESGEEVYIVLIKRRYSIEVMQSTVNASEGGSNPLNAFFHHFFLTIKLAA